MTPGQVLLSCIGADYLLAITDLAGPEHCEEKVCGDERTGAKLSRGNPEDEMTGKRDTSYRADS